MKELPYLKFYPSEWLQGDITLCSLETQGLFINVCSYYWSKQGNVTYSTIKLRLSQAKAPLWDELENRKIIKFDNKKDTINIVFLDEQIKKRQTEHEKYSKAGKAGVEAKKLKNQIVITEAPLKQPLSDALTPLKHIDKEEDKNKKKIFIPPTIEEVVLYFTENGYSESLANKFFNSYNVAKWIDSKGNQVKNWKQKAINVWFKEENKIQKPYISNAVPIVQKHRGGYDEID